jgi:hypothetical protein
MLTPEQIRRRAKNQYEEFLRALCRAEDVFPLALFGAGLLRVDQYYETSKAITELRRHSKETVGYGYDITWVVRKFRRYGEQRVPENIYFATETDYVRFIGKSVEVEEFKKDYAKITAAFRELTSWCQRRPILVVRYHGVWQELVNVCAHLRQHGRPNCYLRELAVEVDTKFIESHKPILGELLPLVAPGIVRDSAGSFEERFGFKRKAPLIRLRCLGDELASRCGIAFNDIAIPLETVRDIVAAAPVTLIVENEMTFLTLPPIPSTLAILGSGDAVSNLAAFRTLEDTRIIYWGDLDVHGLEALSTLRSAYAQVESVMMDVTTLERFRSFAVPGSPSRSKANLCLNANERKVYELLSDENLLLEQERIPLSYVRENLPGICVRLADTAFSSSMETT